MNPLFIVSFAIQGLFVSETLPKPETKMEKILKNPDKKAVDSLDYEAHYNAEELGLPYYFNEFTDKHLANIDDQASAPINKDKSKEVDEAACCCIIC